MVNTQFNKKVLRTENGTEFTCSTPYVLEHDILHQNSMVNGPQQNGRVEPKYRQILNVALVLLFQANLPTCFWGECVLTAAHLINQTPTSVLNEKTPF